MADPTVDDLRSRSRLLLVAGIATDVAAIAALLLPLARGGEVTELLPLALMLFVASSALVLGAVLMHKKAEAAERNA